VGLVHDSKGKSSLNLKQLWAAVFYDQLKCQSLGYL